MGPIGTTFELRPRTDKDIHSVNCGGWTTLNFNGISYGCARDAGQSEETTFTAHNVSQCGGEGCGPLIPVEADDSVYQNIPFTIFSGDTLPDPFNF